MYTRSLMEQNCYHVFKQSIPSDNVPADGSSRPYRISLIRTVHVQNRILPGRGQQYISTTRT